MLYNYFGNAFMIFIFLIKMGFEVGWFKPDVVFPCISRLKTKESRSKILYVFRIGVPVTS